MELQEAIRSRRSIRQFLAQPVSEELIREVIADSLWAPSRDNTQPWEIVLVTGEKKVVMGAVLGWPDPAAPVNQFDRQRGSLDEFGTWVK